MLTPQQMGLIMTAIPLTMAVVSPTAGWLSDRIGYQTLTCLGLIITTFALINLSLLGSSALIAKVVVGLGIYGLGMSLFNAPNNSSVMGSVPLFKLGIAGGVVATGRNLGMVLGVTLSSAVFAYFSLVLFPFDSYLHYRGIKPRSLCGFNCSGVSSSRCH
ncbi:MAG: MFS transporter [Bacillota bacterium]